MRLNRNVSKRVFDFDMIELPAPKNTNTLVQLISDEVIVSSKTYVINLDDDVESPSEYRIISDTLNQMTENDVAIWNINTHGGYLTTTIMLVDDIRNCRGQNFGKITLGSSAGSIIGLALDDCEVVPHGSLFLHEIQSYHEGSTSQQIKQLQFLQKRQRALMEDVYADFLTKEEIDSLLDGNDVEMDDIEANERLEKRRAKWKEQEAGKEDIEEEGEQID